MATMATLNRILHYKHLSEYTKEQFFVDVGIYDPILINCSEVSVSPTYLDDETMVDELMVSPDVQRLNEILKFDQTIMLPCAVCQRELPFAPIPYSQPRIATEHSIIQHNVNPFLTDIGIDALQHHNIFEHRQSYVVGRDDLGIITGDEEAKNDFDSFCRQAAYECKAGLLVLGEARRDLKCTLNRTHSFFSDFIIEDAMPDDIPDDLQAVDLGVVAPSGDDYERLKAYNVLKACVIIRKVGQYPSQSDIQLFDSEKYQSILKKYGKDYRMGLELNACGVGAGAMVYLRRVFEGLMEMAHQECKKKENWREEDYFSKHVDEKIEMLEQFGEIIIHADLAPVRKKLYGVISKGVHELSEEECKNLFPALRMVINEILDEKIRKKEHSERLKNAMVKIGSVQ